MRGATRYTTDHGLIVRLWRAFSRFTWPAVLTMVTLSFIADRLQAPTAWAIPSIEIAGLAALLLTVHHLHLGMGARLQRAMLEMGIVHRRHMGREVAPRRRGLPVRSGRNAVLRWSLPPGVTLRDVLARQEALEHRLACELSCWIQDGVLHTEVLRHRIPDHVDFARFYGRRRPSGRLAIGLGRGRRGALWVDLASLPHLLIGGMTGGGKSVFLRQALTHLVLDHQPRSLRLLCLDLKGGVELASFGDLPHAICPVVDSIEGAPRALGAIRTELDRRLEALRRADLRDVDAWLDAGMPEWPRVVVVVDELAELTVRDLGNDKIARAAQTEACGRLVEIARLGRAVGIHLILCTQRPDAEAVPGQLKANLAGTVAFRVRSGVNSLILLDCDRAALLPHLPGRAIWAHDRLEEFQAIHIDADESRRLLVERWGEPPLLPRGGSVSHCGESPLVNSPEPQQVPSTEDGIGEQR